MKDEQDMAAELQHEADVVDLTVKWTTIRLRQMAQERFNEVTRQLADPVETGGVLLTTAYLQGKADELGWLLAVLDD